MAEGCKLLKKSVEDGFYLFVCFGIFRGSIMRRLLNWRIIGFVVEEPFGRVS